MQAVVHRAIKLKIFGAFPALLFALCLSLGAPAQAQFTGLTPPDSAPTDPDTAAPNDGLTTLLEILKDDAARTRLIEELEAATAADTAATEIGPVGEDLSLGRRIALVTQEFGQDTAATLGALWSDLSSGQSVFSGLRGDEFGILLKALPELLLVVAITVSVFLVLRILARRVYAKLGRSAERAGVLPHDFAFPDLQHR